MYTHTHKEINANRLEKPQVGKREDLWRAWVGKKGVWWLGTGGGQVGPLPALPGLTAQGHHMSHRSPRPCPALALPHTCRKKPGCSSQTPVTSTWTQTPLCTAKLPEHPPPRFFLNYTSRRPIILHHVCSPSVPFHSAHVSTCENYI